MWQTGARTFSSRSFSQHLRIPHCQYMGWTATANRLPGRVSVAATDAFVDMDCFLSVMQMVTVLETMAEADCHWTCVPSFLWSLSSCLHASPVQLTLLCPHFLMKLIRTAHVLKVRQVLSSKLDSSPSCLLNGVSDLNYILQLVNDQSEMNN